MGKCVSKNPTSLTIALSEKDLAASTQIWSKFAESNEYIALKDAHGNQLCEPYYYCVSSKQDDVVDGNGDGVSGEPAKQQNQQSRQNQAPRSNEYKSGQWIAQEIRYDDDTAVAAQQLASTVAATTTTLYTDDYDDADSLLLTSGRHNAEEQCLAHLRLQQRHKIMEHVVTDSSTKHHKNNKNKNKHHKSKSKSTKKSSKLINCDDEDDDDIGSSGALDAADAITTTLDGTKSQWSNTGARAHTGVEAGGARRGNPLQAGSKGQTESKKSAKKHGANAGTVETKGTAMSFGFRKKLNTTPKKLKKLIEGDTKKKQDKCNNVGSDTDVDGTDGVERTAGGGTVIDAAKLDKDDNGNAEPMPKIHFEKMGAVCGGGVGKSAPQKTLTNQGVASAEQQLQQLQQATNRPGAGNRFGYRGSNIVRPASTGITPRYQSDMLHDNVENNNCSNNVGNGSVQQKTLVSNLKRRSKSAHAGRALTSNQSGEEDDAAMHDGSAAATPKITQPKSITFNLNQNSTIEYQRRQFFQQPASTTSGRAWPQQQHRNIINTGMHTNVIVRPTARAAAPAPTLATTATTYSKFTLHTVSLPKPEFPVAISLCATTPTTPVSTYSPSPTTITAGTSSSSAASSHNGARAKDFVVHPLTMAQSSKSHTHMDLKSAKQMANNTRRGFSGSREISADSGIASMDMALDSSASSGAGGYATVRTASPKRSRSRPRNLQMVMSGRHKFEVRELDDPLSSESSSIVEPLALPKLPAENQTMPLPLSGLVRSNTVLSRETYERKQVALNAEKPKVEASSVRNSSMARNPSQESESIDEEKLFLDRSTSEKSAKFRDINTCSSKTSSPGSSIMLSWCNAGESLAMKDCSSLSISSSDDSNKFQDKNEQDKTAADAALELNDDEDISLINTDMQVSTISSLTEAPNATHTLNNSLAEPKPLEVAVDLKPDRPKSFHNALNETKFAEIALAGSTFLLDDETSPTDSLVSSTESEEIGCKQRKHKLNEELQEKDIDEISPELEAASPISPGTPTHASHSLSLSDCGNLIDDEIADQPALLFNNDAQDGAGAGGGADSVASRREKTDTPTLIETASLRSLKSQSKARSALQQAIELSLRTPLSLRKAVMERAESLDTLSPCESICSDDLMMDFDVNSSMDSIDRSMSVKSRSGSDINKIGETELFSELERKGSDVMKELNTILRIHTNRNAEKDSVIAHLPARATRLLNRSRLQQQCPLNNAADSDSSKSAHSVRRSAAASRASTASTSNASLHRSQHMHHSHGSSDDLMLYDKSFRNAMIQDVLQFKKQLLRLRRILQETETLNPFENDNGQLFASCGLDSKLLDDIDLASLTSSTTDDPMQELADLRRQVVYLQGQVDDRDRTIRLQRNLIEKLEAEKTSTVVVGKIDATKECINTATQTERTRPLSIGPEGLSRSKPEYTSYTTHFPAICSDSTTIIEHQQHFPPGGNNNSNTNALNQTRRHTIISTTLTNYNHQLSAHAPRRASIAWEKPAYKPVKITLIGEPLKPLNGQLNGKASAGNGLCGKSGDAKAPQLITLDYKARLLNGDNDLVSNKNRQNGCAESVVYGNGVKHKPPKQSPPQLQPVYQMPHTNGHLNPTVTIV